MPAASILNGRMKEVLSMEAIRVMLADDEERVLDVMTELMASDPTIDVIGRAGDAREAIEVARAFSPDVALVDVRMPGGGGPVAARGIRRDSPPTRVIAVSADTDPDTVLTMLDAGAIGYVAKDEPVERILRAIHRAAAGESSISVSSVGEMAERLADRAGPGVRRHRAAVDRIARVIEERALHIVFQPIVELGGGRIVGVEALSRFDMKPKNMSTEAWFAEASAAGLLTELELVAMHRALEDLARVPAALFLSVNVSPQTVGSEGFLEALGGLPLERLVLELTEATPLEDHRALLEALRPLRDQGLRLAIDDVGAGYSNLARVVGLEPDQLKLDRSVVAGVSTDPLRRSLIERLVAFSDDAGIAVVAEGIETNDDLEALRRLYVPYGQGFHLGRPGPLPPAGEDGTLWWPGRHAFRWRQHRSS
jgi:EAL domain-containing protein (putative c-di-GMP-specific phosphodiesterase class I)/CheY-like chemotaxis protein